MTAEITINIVLPTAEPAVTIDVAGTQATAKQSEQPVPPMVEDYASDASEDAFIPPVPEIDDELAASTMSESPPIPDQADYELGDVELEYPPPDDVG